MMSKYDHQTILILAQVEPKVYAYEIERALDEALGNRGYDSTAEVNKRAYEEAKDFARMIYQADQTFSGSDDLYDRVFAVMPTQWQPEFLRLYDEIREE